MGRVFDNDSRFVPIKWGTVKRVLGKNESSDSNTSLGFSGPEQLAITLLAHVSNEETACHYYQRFKQEGCGKTCFKPSTENLKDLLQLFSGLFFGAEITVLRWIRV